jgi:DNA-binding winged helix-turn-helix (wHTH) protein
MNERVSSEEVAANRLRLGSCVLDLVAGELLTNDGQLAGLRRQALDVLLVLGRRVGQVVGKDELMQRVWPDVVVGEGSLTQAIADIRRTLGDADHRLVRNVARRGYLLVPDDSAAPQVPESRLPAPAAHRSPSTLRRAAPVGAPRAGQAGVQPQRRGRPPPNWHVPRCRARCHRCRSSCSR